MLNFKRQSNHAAERVAERTVELPLSAREIERLTMSALTYVKTNAKCDTAARIAKFDAVYTIFNRRGEIDSQGNELWVVIRYSPTTNDFRIITVMLRDSLQKTEKLKVDKIIRHG